MIVLAREEMEYPIIGCCGLVRNDAIYPVGVSADIDKFKVRALEIIKEYGEDDTYSLEYFEGREAQNFRDDGVSLYKFIRSQDGLWSYYVGSVLKLFVRSYEELITLWKDEKK